MRVSLSQDIVEHKYWGVDGADIESTGRAPMQIEATIPFVNGIVPGKGEQWGVLYPTEFRKFLKAFADRTQGMLQHPELGGILCKPVSLEFSHEAQRRDGVEVVARWVETIENVETAFIGETPIQAADLAALDLDASKADILALVPDAAFPEETFDSFVNKLAGTIDSVTTFVQLITAKPNQILHRIQTLQDSVQRARNALTWPVEEACERMKEASLAIAKSSGNGVVFVPSAASAPLGRKIGRYVTQARTTLAGILSALPAGHKTTTDDLINLNPFLIARPEVGAGVVIRYYV